MNYYTELIETLKLTDIVYKQNFTTEANYFYVDENYNAWTSNTTGDGIADEEVYILHTFRELPFKNCGVPSYTFYNTLKTLSESCVIEQKEDHLLITDLNKKVVIPIVEYVDKPRIDLVDVSYVPIPFSLKQPHKLLLQYVDKNDMYGSKVHFVNYNMISTDFNSIHVEEFEGFGFDFAITFPVFNSMKEFTQIATDEYLYMKDENGSTLVTRYYAPMETCVVEDLFKKMESDPQEFTNITLNEYKEGQLAKIFGANVKKPDRKVKVALTQNEVCITVGDEDSGSAVVSYECSDNPNITFTLNSEKFISLCKYDSVWLYENILWGSSVLGDYSVDKFVQVDFEEE